MFELDDKDRQAELFTDYSGKSAKPQKSKFNYFKLSVSLSYENIFIVSIGLVMFLIVCYSLGVEKGKQLVQARTTPRTAIEIQTKTGTTQTENEPAAQTKPQPKSPQPAKVRIKVAEEQDLRAKPYIQVATFLTDKYANREIESLKNNGYQAFSVLRGKYREIRVGGYTDSQQAQQAFKQLKTVYADCILHNR